MRVRISQNVELQKWVATTQHKVCSLFLFQGMQLHSLHPWPYKNPNEHHVSNLLLPARSQDSPYKAYNCSADTIMMLSYPFHPEGRSGI